MGRRHESPLSFDDRTAVQGLIDACLEHDGGLPGARNDEFIDRWFFAGPGLAVRDERGTLIGAIAVSPLADGQGSATGAVLPRYRNQGIGRELIAWAHAHADGRRLQWRSESVTDSFVHLARRLGYEEVFSELVMRRDATVVAGLALPASVSLHAWSADTVATFFDAYVASFGDRPGFPHWSQSQWRLAMTGDGGFRPEVSVVAVDPSGVAAGFVLLEGDWVNQLGVVPSFRGRGLARALVHHSINALQRTGAPHVWLNVNVNNLAALTLFEETGFTRYGRRGRFERP